MRLALVMALFLAPVLSAQMVDEDLKALQDNSFLLEEGYNQQKGLVQNIGLFIRDTENDAWLFAFRQEWPLWSQTHQVGYVIPIEGNGDTELGDLRLDYRYQLTGNGNTVWAAAPRLSVVLPTGDEEHGFGKSAIEFVLPVSRVINRWLISHTNFGAHADFEEDFLKADLIAGQSFIFALNRNVHLMLEAALREEEGDTDIFVSPGFRFGFSNASGVQFVAGLAAPIGVGHSSGEESVLLYLSVQHPFGRRR